MLAVLAEMTRTPKNRLACLARETVTVTNKANRVRDIG